ncbi:31724_t:CDS:1, partial [Gigaspora margarita]
MSAETITVKTEEETSLKIKIKQVSTVGLKLPKILEKILKIGSVILDEVFGDGSEGLEAESDLNNLRLIRPTFFYEDKNLAIN